VIALIVSARAIYKDGQINFYNSDEVPEDGTEVIINFVKPQKKVTKSLRGSWAKYFPEDFDIDEDLKEMRREWEKEIDELFDE
jgi:hypothetical protein